MPTPTPTPTPTPSCCLPATTTAYEPLQIIYQQFPSRGPAETAWGIVWSEEGHRGLWIQGAWFWRKKPFTWGTRTQVLGRAGLSNIFVPYHNLNPVYNPRILDFGSGGLLGAIPQDAGDCGAIAEPLIASPIPNNPPRRVLIKEIRDRGVAWTSDRQTRRGEEMLLWATYDAGNYEYIIQYGFRDDGTVTFRLGSTGYNSPVRPFEAHMHNALWYVDINLATTAGEVDHNSVMVMKHVEPSGSLTATDSMIPFNNGVEGFVDWNDKEFTHLNIINTLVKNSQGNNIGYDLMPMRTGTARHVEHFSQHDFWVTQTKSNEQDYWVGFEGWPNPPAYITPAEPIMDKDVALWYMSSNHHVPRDEDHEYAQPVRLPGVAHVMWSGFDLHPRNLFNDTPLHEPPCAPVPPNLVGWWPFEEANGATSLLDIQGSANPSINGTPQPSALGAGGPSSVPGVVSRALSFDGNDDYVQIPDNAVLDFGNGDFSIDAWIKTTQSSGVAVVLDKRQPTPLQGYHLFTSNGRLFLQLAVGGNYVNYPSNAYIADGNWHHVAVTIDRTLEVAVKWYLDGLETSKTLNPIAGVLDNSSPLRLGVRSLSLDGYWSGELDELEIFQRVLTWDDVFAMYSAGRNGKCQ
ncbi:MAG TPA: LamG-like jellyroll fold domain-containing protein [Pyrinomonadaceae bacterium]